VNFNKLASLSTTGAYLMVDLTGLSQKQLDAVVKAAQERKAFLAKRFPAAKVKAQVVKFVTAHGYSVEELFGAGAARRKAASTQAPAKRTRKIGKVAPKYRNPADSSETWSGRGRTPRWLSALLAKGKKIEQFLIKG
jgi:DNA-binding protein H-NS